MESVPFSVQMALFNYREVVAFGLAYYPFSKVAIKADIENQVTYNKLLITKRAGEFSSLLVLFILVLGFC